VTVESETLMVGLASAGAAVVTAADAGVVTAAAARMAVCVKASRVVKSAR
jgi:hypothetical protein